MIKDSLSNLQINCDLRPTTWVSLPFAVIKKNTYSRYIISLGNLGFEKPDISGYQKRFPPFHVLQACLFEVLLTLRCHFSFASYAGD